MSETRKVVCDGCGRDRTTTGNCVGWLLTLAPTRVPSDSDMVTLMHIEPPLDSDRHFCGLGCLAAWAKTTYPSLFETRDTK